MVDIPACYAGKTSQCGQDYLLGTQRMNVYFFHRHENVRLCLFVMNWKERWTVSFSAIVTNVVIFYSRSQKNENWSVFFVNFVFTCIDILLFYFQAQIHRPLWIFLAAAFWVHCEFVSSESLAALISVIEAKKVTTKASQLMDFY